MLLKNNLHWDWFENFRFKYLKDFFSSCDLSACNWLGLSCACVCWVSEGNCCSGCCSLSNCKVLQCLSWYLFFCLHLLSSSYLRLKISELYKNVFNQAQSWLQQYSTKKKWFSSYLLGTFKMLSIIKLRNLLDKKMTKTKSHK